MNQARFRFEVPQFIKFPVLSQAQPQMEKLKEAARGLYHTLDFLAHHIIGSLGFAVVGSKCGGVFSGGTRKHPPLLVLTTGIPKDPIHYKPVTVSVPASR